MKVPQELPLTSSPSQHPWRERLTQLQAPRLPPAPAPAERVELGASAGVLRTRDHAALVYWEPREFLTVIVPYLVEGLRCGDKVVHIAHEEPLPALESALRAAGVEVEQAVREGRLVLTTAHQAFFGEGRFDVERSIGAVQALASEARRQGFGRVRFSVDMTYLLADVPGIETGPEFEARVNEEVFARFPFVCICSFNGARDVSNLLEEVLATHPVLLASGLPLANPYYRPGAVLSRGRGAPPGADPAGPG